VPPLRPPTGVPTSIRLLWKHTSTSLQVISQPLRAPLCQCLPSGQCVGIHPSSLDQPCTHAPRTAHVFSRVLREHMRNEVLGINHAALHRNVFLSPPSPANAAMDSFLEFGFAASPQPLEDQNTHGHASQTVV
jgi:hypothetical protein